jgi:hypothetical protein
MSNLRQRGAENPTTCSSKVVASLREKSRVLRKCLAAAVHSIRRKRRWPEVQGELSSWILHMHGFKDRCEMKPWHCRYTKNEGARVAEFLNKALGPEMDAQQVERALVRSQKVANEKGPLIAEARRRGDLGAFESLFSEMTLGILDSAGIPKAFSELLGGVFYEDVVKSLRACRALVSCLVVHGEHPLVLINRASKGDRRAVLDLVEIDGLFMHDSCCSEVIRRAELQEDQEFIEQLKKAVGKQPSLRSRDIKHVYYYILFLFEAFGSRLPRREDLWNAIDPLGAEYESLSAFEKDFQRSRQVFKNMLAAAEAEIMVQGSEPPFSSDSSSSQK